MSYYGFQPYVTVAEKKEKAEKALKKLMKQNPNAAPVVVEGRTIGKSWWGKAWNDNLKSYADFDNRIQRGRSYVKQGAVLDLQIKRGMVEAVVLGSRVKPYTVLVQIDELGDEKWKQVTQLCNNRIASLEVLLDGKFPKELEVLFREKSYGLFPAPKEIHFDCSCPDYASMCKHVAAVLYGIGVRLDENPLLFFELRGVDSAALLKRSMESKLSNMLKNAGKKSDRMLDAKDVPTIFGL